MKAAKPAKKAKPAGKASHDLQHPKPFIDFMLQGWQPKKKAIKPLKEAAQHVARRQTLSREFLQEWLVIPTGQEVFRNGDATYRFRPNSSFVYYTGNHEPDCVLVLQPKGRSGHESILYVEPNPGRSEPTFFTDRHKGELWVGPRLGVSESKVRYGVDRCRPLGELPALLATLKSTKAAYRVLRGIDAQIDRALPARKEAEGELATFISEQRLIKDKSEIAALKSAAASTRRGFEDIVRCLQWAKNERDVEGAFYARARREGNDVGYNIIAAAGAHACILHWNNNDGPLRKNNLLLVDAGVEGPGLYTADVTRTLPIGGRFSRTQRQVYDWVIAAQRAAFDAARAGNDFLAPHRAAMEVLARGLVEMGILKVSLEEALDPQKQYYRRYTLHGTSHMLGLDVHDCDRARPETYRMGKLRPGMVLTIEPGLYFQEDDLTVPNRFRGIGIRIEDDILVTKGACRILTDVPRGADDVERWIADIWAAGA